VVAGVSFAAAAGLAASVVLIIRHIFEMDGITIKEVIGGLTAYTQIALAFSFLYSGASVLTDGDFFNNGIAGTASDFIYFSVVTVTTLGYGDLTPATNVGRSLVVLETLIGQILLIVLVAFLVGRLGPRRGAGSREKR
jgi:voltage-gated potassium channel Kch